MTKRAVHRILKWMLPLTIVLVHGCAADGTGGPPAAAEEDLTGDVNALEDTLACDGATSVDVSITGTDITEVTPVDLMLVVDESGSIEPTEFEQQRTFMLDLVSALSDLFDHGGRMGLVMFNEGSRLFLGLNGDDTVVSTAIGNVPQLGGATCIGCGIAEANAELSASSGPDRAKVIVVLTDGFSNVSGDAGLTPFEYVEATASDAEALGAELFAVGVGEAVSQPELQAIGTGPDNENVFNVSDFADLQSILADLAAAVVSPEATNGELTLVINDAFDVLGAGVTSGAVNVVDNTLTWTIPQILNETVTCTYDIEHRPEALSGLKPLHESVAYIDAEGNPLALPEAEVQIVGCDEDGDGVIDEEDACPGTAPGAVVDAAGCSIDQLCVCEADWKNDGQYVSCVAHASEDFLEQGLITEDEKDAIVSAAGQSDCGDKR